jgi:hypothetical protein
MLHMKSEIDPVHIFLIYHFYINFIIILPSIGGTR